MNNKKLNAYLRKELRKLGTDLKREKARCARLYPDWVDDEFNMLDNLFIWGYNTDPKAIPSFYSWDDAYIYFNRQTKKYYMTIDTGFYGVNYDEEFARVELDRLDQIDLAFRDFLIEKGLPMRADTFPFEDPALEAETLSELYVKFRIMIEGYKVIQRG
jgi:hypothetical protein